MDIGTAKPSADEQTAVRHHLLDVADVNEIYTVANYKEAAGHAIDDIHARGKIPIVCGGTGLYARALLEGLSIPEVPPNQNCVRSSTSSPTRTEMTSCFNVWLR